MRAIGSGNRFNLRVVAFRGLLSTKDNESGDEMLRGRTNGLGYSLIRSGASG
tara:strand:+ start:37551 stop:37706 length:156 start_codon:yes stop_codon:yes gene_type:complete